ncbi:hypothetical protein ACKWTF_008210 [Chironomus riparius]
MDVQKIDKRARNQKVDNNKGLHAHTPSREKRVFCFYPPNICTNGNTTKNYRHEKEKSSIKKKAQENRYLAQIFQMEYKSAFCPFFVCIFTTQSHIQLFFFSLPTFLQYRAHTQMHIKKEKKFIVVELKAPKKLPDI